MRRLAVSLVLVVALPACSVHAPRGATPPDCHEDTPEAGVCSPLRPTA